MNIYDLPVIIVEGLREANYLMEHGCDFIGLAEIPSHFASARMRFRGSEVAALYKKACELELPPLTIDESNRLNSMLALFCVVMKKEALG